LPRILATLKARGYHIVQVVPATPDRPATPTEPRQWLLHPPSENVAISHWPKVPNFVIAETTTLVRPVLSDFDGADASLLLRPEPFDRATRHVRGTPLQTPWPQEWLLPVATASARLPVPAKSVFELPELPHPTAESVAQLGPRSKPAAVVAERETPPEAAPVSGGDTPRVLRGKHGRYQRGHGKQMTASRKGRHGTMAAAHGRPGKVHAHGAPLKHLAQIKKRKV
jgi:hypothetical protein